MGKLIVVINLVILNLLVGGIGYLYYQNVYLKNVSSEVSTTMSGNPVVSYVDKCGSECKVEVERQVGLLKTELSAQVVSSVTPTPVVVTKTVSQTTSKTKVRSVSYVTIPGSGNTLNNEWTDLSGTDFYFDTKDYPGLVEVYFEANVKLFNGNGKAYFRLYDSNNGVGVQGSDIETQSQISSLNTSGKVTFWAGKNKIRVQAKSLTADTAVFESGRLRIVTEN